VVSNRFQSSGFLARVPARGYSGFDVEPQHQEPYPWWTLGFSLLTLGIFWIAGQGQSPTPVDDLVSMGALSSSLVSDGQVWRILSANFVHVDLLHVMTNITVLVALGYLLEPVIGHRRFAVIYIVGAIAGGLASVAASPSHVVVGSSGALLGVLGGTLTLLGKERLGIHGLVLLVGACVLVLGLGSMQTEVATSAHVGGLLGGLTVGILFRGFGHASTPRCRLTRAAFIVCGFLLFYAATAATIHATMQPDGDSVKSSWAQSAR